MKVKTYRSNKFQKVDEFSVDRITCAPEPEDMTDDERKDINDGGHYMLTVDKPGTGTMFIPTDFLISVEDEPAARAAKRGLEMHAMLALSTAHLDTKTCNLMYAGGQGIGCTWYRKELYKCVGYFVAVPDELDDDMPKCLRDCCKFAQENGADWIMFDCDVNTISDLPVYGW